MQHSWKPKWPFWSDLYFVSHHTSTNKLFNLIHSAMGKWRQRKMNRRRRILYSTTSIMEEVFSVKYRGNKHQRGVWCSMARPENKWQVTVSRYCEVLLIKEAETICQWMFVTRHNKSHEWNTWKENRQTPAWNPPTGYLAYFSSFRWPNEN